MPTDNSGPMATEIALLQTEKCVVLEVNRGLSPIVPIVTHPCGNVRLMIKLLTYVAIFMPPLF